MIKGKPYTFCDAKIKWLYFEELLCFYDVSILLCFYALAFSALQYEDVQYSTLRSYLTVSQLCHLIVRQNYVEHEHFFNII